MTRSLLKTDYPDIKASDSRKRLHAKITEIAVSSETALLSLYIYRQMDMIEWMPFVKASLSGILFAALLWRKTAG